ncbi:hypothetical protein PRZ48_013811 [Zasmidium cellare]|uniref:Alpha/beta hydrolase fold-3 domain-containing protein n=1 Tax=Zasmidium cellare TaxID=395010 RepID=A0ABR0E262_ZASCE|nr:hypothetical protein PRZ48_013811 [Zasmidium cellare]
MDPEVEEYLRTHPSEPLPTDITAFRSISAAVETAAVDRLGAPSPSLTESYLPIPMRDGHLNTAKVFQPSTSTDGSPLVVLFHGGGFAVGSPEQFTLLGRALVELLNCTVVSAAYRLAPERPFPAAAEDAWDTTQHLATNPPDGSDLAAGFLVGGASSGANLAAVVAQLAVDRRLDPPLTGQFLSLPLIFSSAQLVPEKFRAEYTSLTTNTTDPIQSLPSLHAILARYNPTLTSPFFSPINSPNVHPPKTYIQVCGLDPLRDDGVVYGDVLRERGVETRVEVYEGFPHGWWVFMPGLRSSKRAVGDMVRGVGWLLGRGVEGERVVGKVGEGVE